MRSSNAALPGDQEHYIRMRENPYFDGLLKGDNQALTQNVQGNVVSRIISRSTSDADDLRHRNVISNVSEKVMDSRLEDPVSNITLEPLDSGTQGSTGSQNMHWSTLDIGDTREKEFFSKISEKVRDLTLKDSDVIPNKFEQPPSGRRSKIVKATSFGLPKSQWDFSHGAHNDSVYDPTRKTFETNDEYHALDGLASLAFEKSYNMEKKKPNLSHIPLPESAATFYNGFSPEMEIFESCETVNWLNRYLKARRDAVNAGVPGQFLHAVMGQDISDVGLVASTIMYAFYLNETRKSNQLCTVPVINMKRQELSSHAEIRWLIESCQIDQSSLIFVDEILSSVYNVVNSFWDLKSSPLFLTIGGEIDLSYYDLFGSLKLVLVNSHKLPGKQEALKEAVVEVFSGRKGEPAYTWVETVTMGQDCSCCTLIAEKFALISPEILAGQGFSRLLLAGILMDTGNLTNPHCTSKDKYMATLLINGAGRFGCNGLYQLLKYKMYDVSDLKIVDILRKDFKKWTSVGKLDAVGSRHLAKLIGMSSIGMSLAQLVAHENTSYQEIKNFHQLEKLRVLVIISGYYDSQKNFKREMLIFAESVELKRNLIGFMESQLPLKILHQPGLRDEVKAFEINEVTSRKTIERLLEEFAGTLKG